MTTRDNSWVLITGASSGFGEEFARQYAEQGHPLVLVARRLDRLQTLAESLRQQHHIEVIVNLRPETDPETEYVAFDGPRILRVLGRIIADLDALAGLPPEPEEES